MPVVVTPATFTMVDFDADAIRTLVEDLATRVGLGDRDVTIEIDERTPLSKVEVRSIEPLHVVAEGGALEDLRRIRQLSPARAADALGLHLLMARDRLDPAFGAPSLHDDVPLAHQVAWEAYAMGRLARAGHPSQHARRLYHFRNRHGFSDAADASFERLWTASGLTWAQVVDLSDAAAAG